MNIYDLINMKKDILINGYSTLSTLEESYDCIESSPEEEYLNTICENFDLSLENANLQLFHYGSEEYIYEVLEENEYWDITEEGVISAIGEGIKKIINAIISLIRKIVHFIANLFRKIASIFDRNKSEMDEVDRCIDEYNKAVKEIFGDIERDIRRDANKLGKEINKMKRIDEIRHTNPYELTDEEDEMDNRVLYNHNQNAKFDLSLGPQSLDSLYNRFGKEIKIKSPIYYLNENKGSYMEVFAEEKGKDIDGVYMKIKRVLDIHHTGGLSNEEINEIKELHQNLINGKEDLMRNLEVTSEKEIPNGNKLMARAEFIRNYKDEKWGEITINKIPLQHIKYYAYNADSIRERLKDLKTEADKIFNENEDRMNSLKISIEREKNMDSTVSSSIKEMIRYMHILINGLGVYVKEYVKCGLGAVNTSVSICKRLTKKLYKVQNGSNKK